MKLFQVICVLACTVIPTVADYMPGSEDPKNKKHDGSAMPSPSPAPGRRRLFGRVNGPCAMFPFVTNSSYTCPVHPPLTPRVFANAQHSEYGMSMFATNWIEYTCCKIVRVPLNEIIASIWMWLQVCTKVIEHATPGEYAKDEAYASKTKDYLYPYKGGPLKTMKHYCPKDLEGGLLTEWVVATFFPVMEKYNRNFEPVEIESLKTCETTNKPGAVTLLLDGNDNNGTSFGHIALVMHEDYELTLPAAYDNNKYVSFSNYKDTIGVMLTGTKADHQGFGRYLENVTKTLTLYNADVKAMNETWTKIKDSRQMFDLMEWNCARTTMEVLFAGFPDCRINLKDQKRLWTPTHAFAFARAMKRKVNVGSPNVDKALKDVHARQLKDPVPEGPDLSMYLAIIFVALAANMLLAAFAAALVILKIKQDAEKTLEQGLGNLLIAHSTTPFQPNSGAPTPPNRKPGNAIISQMDSQSDKCNADGTTDFEEFTNWAKSNKLSTKQIKIVWNDLDKDKDGTVSKPEWERFISKKPKLKWLVHRLQSVRRSRRHTRSSGNLEDGKPIDHSLSGAI